jgi:hypothetical protein
MWMGANKFVKAQVGRLPDDEGTSFSVYVYGFFQVDGNCNLWIEVPYSNKTEWKLPLSANIWVLETEQAEE